MKRINPAHLLLERHMDELGLVWQREVRIHATRRWRLDYFLPDYRIGIEIHGATWAGGRHTRGKGFENDRRKMNHAEMTGTRVLEFTTNMVNRGEAKAFLAEHLGAIHG